MKKNILFTLILLTFASCVYAQDVKLFNKKNGIIEYKLSGFSEGKQTIYFDNYGADYIIEQDINYFETPNKSKTYIVKDSSYTLDLNTKLGYKFQYVENMHYINYFKVKKDVTLAYEELYKMLGAQNIGKEKIKGVECQIWEMPRGLSKIWIADGIVYKMESKESGQISVKELVQIDFNVSFNKGFFDKPADVEFKVFNMNSLGK